MPWVISADAAVWYVNDTSYSTTTDSFTYAVGADTQPGTAAAPLRHIKQAIDSAAAGDTIFIDAGLYDSFVTVSSTETAGVNISKDSLTLIGKDSAATVIDPPGLSTQIGLYGIYADTQVNLLIKNLGVTGARDGIRFLNVDRSAITSDSVSSCGNDGIHLRDGSDTNTVTNNSVNSNSTAGIDVISSVNDTLSGNTANSNSSSGILLTTSSNITVTGNTANSNFSNGIYLFNTNTSNTISNNTVNSNTDGINLNNSSSNNTVTGNSATSNSNSGINLQASSNNNTLSGNTTNSATSYGIILQTSANNIVTGNTANSNSIYGIYLSATSDSNRLANNMVKNNIRAGIVINNSSLNIAFQNDVAGGDTGLYVFNASVNDTFTKNNIQSNTVNNVYNASGNPHTLTRNWFGSADSVAIKNKISDTASAWSPYRLGTVDTASGADTTAPKAPDTVAVVNSPCDTSIILEWTNVTTQEELNGGAVSLSAYKIYRSTVKDTSSWVKVAQVGIGSIRYQDTDVSPGQVYYYRVTAFDTATPFANESFFSDSQPSDSAVFSSRVNWYVNDTWVNGTTDSFTYVGGSDTGGDGTAQKPFRSIAKAVQLSTAGDTVFIDAGLFTETVVINIDSANLIGKDSNATVIDPPGANATAGLYGIYADTQTGLLIKNIGVTGAFDGVRLVNVDRSTLSNDSASSCGEDGFFLINGSETNTVSGVTSLNNLSDGIAFSSNSTNNTLTNSVSNSNTSNGVYLSVGSCTVAFTTASSNGTVGIYLVGVSNNTLSNNTLNSNASYGIQLLSATNNTLTGNTANFNSIYGVWVGTTSTGNTLTNNTANSNSQHGIVLNGSSDNCALTGNTANSNTLVGIYFGTSNSSLKSSTANSNDTGIYVLGSSNTIAFNMVMSDSSAGLEMFTTTANLLVQNTFQSNSKYQIVLEASSSTDTFQKNNILTSGSNPDSAVLNLTNAAVDFTRNWWNSADSIALSKKIADTSAAKPVKFQPYRLGQVDTAVGGDTVAPKAPDTVAVIGSPSDTSIILEWTAVTTNEEAAPGGVALSAYRVYRSEVKDTSSWVLVQQQTAIRWQDTNVAPGRVYYYRVTAFDTALPFANESFFSDSQPSDSAVFTSRVNWYVNDAWVSGATDSFTYVGGSDTGGDGTAQKPFKSIPLAMRLATAGDTIFLDAGLYDSFVILYTTETVGVNIDKDSISLIGRDSALTVIDPPGTAGMGIFADTQTNLLIKNLGVTGASNGIEWEGVTRSTITGDSVSDNAGHGMYIRNFSDTNTVSNNVVYSNGNSGINILATSQFDTVANNYVTENNSHNIFFQVNSDSPTITNNTAGRSATGDGISIQQCKSPAIRNNISESNAVYGLQLQSVSPNAIVRHNVIRNNTRAGIFLSNANSAYIAQNDISGNDTGVWFSLGTGYIVTRNNITSNKVNNLYNSAGNGYAVSRNWWGTTQEDQIAAKFTDTANTYRPYRLGVVDTASGADTRAPYLFDTSIVLTAGNKQITVTWDTPTQDEDTEPLSTFGLVSIYRIAAADTTNWTAARVGDVNAGKNTFVDTGLTNYVKYYYRLTASDTATIANASFFTDTKSATPVWSDTGRVTVYVSSFGDSSDPELGDTTKAFKNIKEAVSALTPNNGVDTIVVFAKPGGDSYYEQVDLTADSGLVLISRKAQAGTDAVLDTWAKIAFDTGPVVKGWKNVIIEGFIIDGIDSTRTLIAFPNAFTPDSVTHSGIFLPDGTDQAAIRNVYVRRAYYGIGTSFTTNSKIVNSHVTDIGRDGIHIGASSSGNEVSGDTVERVNESTAHGHGIKLNSASNNTVRSNTVNGANYGVELDLTNPGNRIYSNNILNVDTGLWFSGASKDSFVKNNILNAKKNIEVAGLGGVDARHNWWGTRDVNIINNGVAVVTAGGTYAIHAVRASPVDTRTPTSDTVAPGVPETVAVNGASVGGGQVTITWDTPDFTDEGDTSGPQFGQYRIYRLTVPDTTDWKNAFLASVNAGVITYVDTAVTDGVTYYYRISSYENLGGGFENESVFSDTKSVVPSIDTTGPNIWYVNDTSTTGDSFTIGTGSDTQTGLSRALPLRNITRVMRLVSAGDTVYIDKGVYDSFTTTAAGETAGVKIDTDNISIIGADSNTVIINPQGDSSAASQIYGIYADTQSRLTIKNVGVTDVHRAVYFINVDLSTIASDSFSLNGGRAMYLINGSDTNTISGNLIVVNGQEGIELATNSNNNSISNNTFKSNGSNGIYLNASSNNTVNANVLTSNTQSGVALLSSTNNTLSGNTATSNAVDGFNLSTSTNNTVSNNTSNSNSSNGIKLISNSNGNTISGNITNSNAVDGILLTSNNRGNVLSANVSNSNLLCGILIGGNSDSNIARNNLIRSNASVGVQITISDSNIVYQNDISGGDTGVLIEGGSRNNFVSRNNILASNVNLVYNSGGLAQTALVRNWFGATQETLISAKFTDTADVFKPYRLGLVDTAAGADTSAPKAPDTITVDTSSGVSVVLTWVNPTQDEDTNVLTGFNGVKIYRLVNTPDTTDWANAPLVKTTATADTTWTDTAVNIGNTYYYRLSSFDTAAKANASFFADTKTAPVAVPGWGGPVWYVDKDTGADTQTGHPNYPFKTIAKALQTIPADTQQFDTILLDRNTYTETVVIDTDYIWLEGVDSATSVIDPPGPSTSSGLYAIYADTQSNLVIRNLGVTGALDGIRFENVDSSIVTMDSASSNGRDGISLLFGSDSNIVTKNTAAFDSGAGITLISSLADSINANTLTNNETNIYLLGSSNIAISNNRAVNSSKYGIYLQSSSNNTVSNNSVTNNSWDGINLTAASNNNIIQDNIFANNSNSGITFWNAHINTVRRNLAYGHSGGAAIHLTNADTNEFYQNESRTNQYGVWIEQTGNDPSQNNKFIRNNIIKPDSYGIFIGNGQTDTPFFWRNFLDTTNEGNFTDNITTTRSLFGLVWDRFDSLGLAMAIDTQPRFAPVDTTATGDSLAPNVPSPATIPDSSSGAVRVQWVLPTVTEAGDATAGITGIRIYRTTNGAEKDWKTNSFLIERPSTDTQYLDLTVVNGLTYYYRVTATDSATFPNESYFTDSAVGLPGGVFVDNGNMRVYVSDQGAGNQPTLADSPGAAFPNLDSAIIALNPANGYDTIIVFNSKFSDSYAMNGTKELDTGVMLFSKKSYMGNDTGGGGDSFVTFRFYASGVEAVIVPKQARVEGMILTAAGSSGVTGLKVYDTAIVKSCSVQNVETGVQVVSGAGGVIIESCTAANLASGIGLSGVGATVKKCSLTGNNRAGIQVTGASGGNHLIVDNQILSNGIGVDVKTGSITILRNTIQGSAGSQGIFSLSGGQIIVEANDITSNDTGISFQSGTTGGGTLFRWNNLAGNTMKNFHSASTGGIDAKYNWWGSTDMSVVDTGIKSNLAGGVTYAPYRFAQIDSRAAGDSIAPDSPPSSTFVADVSVPGQITVRWQPPSQNEDGSPVGTITGYRVYRLANSADTTNWKGLTPLTDTNAADTFVLDANVAQGNTYYYRVLAFDPNNNEGWLADTKSGIPIFSGTGQIRLLSLSSGSLQFKTTDSVLIEVNDSDPNTNGASRQTTQCTFVNLNFPDTVIMVLTEISVNSSIFQGTVPLTSGSGPTVTTDTVLYVRPGDKIKAIYNDGGPERTSATITILAPGISGDSVQIDSGNHQIISGSAPAVLEVSTTTKTGDSTATVTVTFFVEYEGSVVGSTSGTTSETGHLRQLISLTSGEGAYVITVSCTPGIADDQYVVVYTDKRKVGANKWVMIAPFKQPDPSLTGLGQLSYSGTALSYSYDPSISLNSTFNRYKSVTGQASPNAAGVEFTKYDTGQAYWFKSTVATSVGLLGTPSPSTASYAKVRMAAGANMIGNPFPYFINWLDDVYVETDVSGPMVSLSQLRNSAVIDTKLQWRDQSAEQYITSITSSGEDSVQLKPWVGYWVKINTACTMTYFGGTKRMPQSTKVKQSAPVYSQGGGDASSWRIRLKAYSDVSEIRDEYAFLGVAPGAVEGEDMNDMWKAPGMLGDMQVLVGEAVGAKGLSPAPGSASARYYAASIAPPVKTATAWPVVVTAPAGIKSAALSWEAGGVPEGLEAYVIGGPAGPVNMRKSSSMPLVFNSPAQVQVVVGTPEYLAAFLASPLSKEQTFVYPNPGPDAAGNVTFKYNLQAAGDVTLKIYDVGGKLVKELKESGAAGSNTTLKWDGTNKNGQKVGSGVYIYIMEGAGNKLVDKLAIVR